MLSAGADVGSLIHAPDGRAPRTLIGEPDPATRERLRRVLASAGCRIEEVIDRRAAFAAMHDPPDLVVADAALAQRHGFALLRQFRAHPANNWLPIILLSSEPSESGRREALDAGADDYLEKPFAARELLSRVGLHLAISRVRREASEAVQASERRLADVLEAIGEAVFAIDSDQRILFVNRKALELWNREGDEIVGRGLLDAFPEMAAGEPYRALRQVIATGRPVHLEVQAPLVAHRWIELDAYPAPEGDVVVAFRDIDTRKRAETRLRESEERFRLMLEALPDIAFVIRPDGTAEHYNQQFRDYTGMPAGPLPADRLLMHPPDDRERLDLELAEGFASGREFVVEARLRRYDDVYRWHRIRNRPVRVAGKIAFWLGTAVDIDDMREANALLERRVAERTAELEAANRRLAAQIDERERAEAQLRQAQRIEAVGQLTSGVAHDFNNLLTAIIGNLELLEARLNGAEDRLLKPLSSAASAAERGARLTAQLLAFSRQQQMTPEPVDLNQVVLGMGGLLQSTIGATVNINTVLSPDLWSALADASQIELVLLNLAINARDAMPDGGDITVATANRIVDRPERPEEPAPGDYVVVSVGDTGTGIPSEILDKVFNPFFTTKEIGKGSGLGLSQVLGVTQQLGGGVRIDTRRGAGTTVAVFLPRAPDNEAVRRRRRDGSPAGIVGGGGRILLVDDDPDVRAVAAAMLGQAGYDVTEAGSGGAALDLLERGEPEVELMIVDIIMPGMSGIELAHAVRLSRPDLPVLFVTGFAGTALPAGQTVPGELLRKPFRTAELAAKVAAMLGRTHRRSAAPLRRAAAPPIRR